MDGERTPHGEMVNDRAKLIMHRLIVGQIRQNPDHLVRIKANVAEQSMWAELHSLGLEDFCRAILRRTEAMRHFRKSSAMMGIRDLTDYDLRKRIWRKAKLGKDIYV